MASYVVGQRYRDRSAAKKTPGAEADEDQFLGWLNVNGRGMQAFGGIRWLGTEHRAPKLIVLLSSEPVGRFARPWNDILMRDQGILLYWGDARSVEEGKTSERGNVRLRAAWKVVQACPRAEHPLILYFRRNEKGWVTFEGLGHLVDLQPRSFLDGSEWVVNELAQVALLPSRHVEVEWLRGWASPQSFTDRAGAPPEYLAWASGADSMTPVPEHELVELLGHHLQRALSETQKAAVSVAPPPGTRSPGRTSQTAAVFIRDLAVRAWVLERAAGVCEFCKSRAPFIDSWGAPFLEVHHVVTLSEGGPDTVDNAAGLCPNCHRRLHLASDRRALVETLYQRVRELRRPG